MPTKPKSSTPKSQKQTEHKAEQTPRDHNPLQAIFAKCNKEDLERMSRIVKEKITEIEKEIMHLEIEKAAYITFYLGLTRSSK